MHQPPEHQHGPRQYPAMDYPPQEYPGPPGPPPPFTQPPRRKKFPGWLVGIIVAIVALCGIGAIAAVAADSGDPSTAADSEPERGEPAVDEPEPETEPEPPALPEPEAEYGGTCDMLLFVQGDMSEFAASVDVVNIGNVGVKVKVTASFDQLGQNDYVLKDTVKVKPGAEKTVNLSELIGTDIVDRHQNGGYECRIEATIVDTFGEPQ